MAPYQEMAPWHHPFTSDVAPGLPRVPGRGAMHRRGARHPAAPLGAAAADPGANSGGAGAGEYGDFPGGSRILRIFVDFHGWPRDFHGC